MLKQSASNPASYPTNSGKRTAVVTERRCTCCGGAGESVAGAVCGACRGAGVVSVRNR
jgi:DnaJ-class molecular chaperone